MKFIKVTALAAAMMTTFGAQAELTAMDDAALEAVTGQQSINITLTNDSTAGNILTTDFAYDDADGVGTCLLYTSPSPRDQRGSRMPSSA